MYQIGIIGVQEEEEKEKGHKKIFQEIIVENFPNMAKHIDIRRGQKEYPPLLVFSWMLYSY